MKIGIDYRMLSAGPNTVNRGMGRYTQQQIREVLKIDYENEYLLFCLPNADSSLILPEIRAAQNVSIETIRRSSDQVRDTSSSSKHLLRDTEAFQQWVYHQNVDIYHATTPFLWMDTTAYRFDACPMVATFYDLIPLIYPQKYLPDHAPIHDLYGRSLRFIQDAVRFITISQSAKIDASRYLGFPQNRIDIAYPIADPCFTILTPKVVQANLRKLRERVRIPESFVLCVTYPHHSKNLEKLLEAYSLLPTQIRTQIPLVLTFVILDDERERMQHLLARYDVADAVILTDFVTEDELVALYNAATLVVHPSRYEGFGLPVVEAMRCGSPVITTTSSSLPEVGGNAAVLVDPDDAQGFADAIEELCTNRLRREEMSARGLIHAEIFSPEQLGRNTLGTYIQTHEAAKLLPEQPQRQRIALWSPLPPLKTGIANYSADLVLEPLSKIYDVEVFVDDGYLPRIDLLTRYNIHNYRAFERRQHQQPFDSIIYQIGSSQFHLYMSSFIERYRGIAVLHDLTWGRALYHSQISSNIDVFKRMLLDHEGAAALTEYERLVQIHGSPVAEEVEQFIEQHYMLRAIIDGSSAQIVHAEWFKQEVEKRYSGSNTYTVVHGVEDPWRGISDTFAQEIRSRLGLSVSAFVVGIFGIVEQTKRVDVSLKAFEQLSADFPDSYLLVVGEQINKPYAQQLKQLVQQLHLSNRVLFADYVSNDRFLRLLLACDVVVNLRYPSRQQMSGTLVQALAAGKPTIITNLPEWDFIPNDVCLRLVPDEQEVENLAEYLVTLAVNPQLRRQFSTAARRYYKQTNTVEHMAIGYQHVIEQVVRPVRRVSSRAIDAAQDAPLAYNKIASPADLAHPDLATTASALFQHTISNLMDDLALSSEYRKHWEIVMSVRTLQDLGAIHSDALILCAGAGLDVTPFYLANHVRQVYASDRYVNADVWRGDPPSNMLIAPERVAPLPFPPERLVVQQMDGRILHYPADTFDGVVSNSVIEHYGDVDFAANAAYEMGRVLKPGGILALSTKLLIAGPPSGTGWNGSIVFTADALQRYIVEASGLELVDALDTDVSGLLDYSRDITLYRRSADTIREDLTAVRIGEPPHSLYPYTIVVHNGYVVCTVHLALRKTNQYPVAPNLWAKPNDRTTKAVANNTVLASAGRSSMLEPPIAGNETSPLRGLANYVAETTQAMIPDDLVEKQAQLRKLLQAWNGLRIRGWYNSTLRRLPSTLSQLGRTLVRVLTLGKTFEAQAQFSHALLNYVIDLTETMARVQPLEQPGIQFEPNLEEIRSQLAELQGQLATTAESLQTKTDAIEQLSLRQKGQSEQLNAAEQQLSSLDNRLTEIASQLARLIDRAEKLSEK